MFSVMWMLRPYQISVHENSCWTSQPKLLVINDLYNKQFGLKWGIIGQATYCQLLRYNLVCMYRNRAQAIS